MAVCLLTDSVAPANGCRTLRLHPIDFPADFGYFDNTYSPIAQR